MRKLFTITLIAVLALGLVVPFAAVKALEVVQTQGTYQLNEDKTIDDSFIVSAERVDLEGILVEDSIVAGSQVTLTGTAQEDVIMAGGILDLSGVVEEDAMLAGGQITVAGDIHDDLTIAGGQLDVRGIVKGSVIAAGGSLKISAESVIEDNLIIGAGTVILEGTVKGDIYGGAGTIEIVGNVEGDVHIYAGRVFVRSSAVINGDLTYFSNRDASIEEGSQIDGQIDRRTPIAPVILGVTGVLGLIVGFVISVLGFFIVGILYIRFFTKFVKQSEDEMAESFWGTFWKGLVVFIFTPIISFLLMFTVIGLPLACILMVIWGLALFVGQILFAMYLGDIILRKKDNERGNSILSLLIGVVITQVIFLIPFVGWFLRLIAIILGLGMIWLAWRKNTTADFTFKGKAKK
ncbi:hypothetical protein ACFL1U_03090 [Patescibacteria group bacterium]